jgi:hypothetical protein
MSCQDNRSVFSTERSGQLSSGVNFCHLDVKKAREKLGYLMECARRVRVASPTDEQHSDRACQGHCNPDPPNLAAAEAAEGGG